jgi:hypothetical protein
MGIKLGQYDFPTVSRRVRENVKQIERENKEFGEKRSVIIGRRKAIKNEIYELLNWGK